MITLPSSSSTSFDVERADDADVLLFHYQPDVSLPLPSPAAPAPRSAAVGASLQRRRSTL